MSTSNVRFGVGVTREVGLDLKELKCINVGVFTDKRLATIPNSPLLSVLQSLTDNKIRYHLYSDVRIEPTDESFKHAINFAQQHQFDAFVAVGGGSVIDTTKAANLYSSYPVNDFLDYVNPPIGKGKAPAGPLKPLIAIPTTAGTGSETTGVAIFDLHERKVKTGIAHRLLRPTLALVDPNNTRTLPRNVAIASGFDVLCHALESYTAIEYDKRRPRPPTPLQRPTYQGANPISDVWSLKALEMLTQYFVRSVEDPTDDIARANMLLASTYAGIGFGNAGVHLCHGMSYPVSGMVRNYFPEDYPKDHPIIPHGLSVVLHAPAVFRFTSVANPERCISLFLADNLSLHQRQTQRHKHSSANTQTITLFQTYSCFRAFNLLTCCCRHLTAARIMGVDVTNLKSEDAGRALVDKLLALMARLNVPNGLKAVGFNERDIPELVKGTLPQHRVTKLSPRPAGEAELTQLFNNSMVIY
jgi:hydroxyacid-oxoacid transhydrogenase